MRQNIIELFQCTALLAFFFVSSASAVFSPKISKTEIEHLAEEYLYFDDSSNIAAWRPTDEHRSKNKLQMSFDDGQTWDDVETAAGKKIVGMVLDEFDRKRAIAIAKEGLFFITKDSGHSWSSFQIPKAISKVYNVEFNAKDSNLVLVNALHCDSRNSVKCQNYYYYTDDNFKTSLKPMAHEVGVCTFAKSNKQFRGGSEKTVYCSMNKLNSFEQIIESEIVASDDFMSTWTYFETTHLPSSKSGAIIDIRIKETFLIVVVQSDKFNKKSHVKLLISKDGKRLDETDLQIDISVGVLTFLDSSPTSLFISILDYSYQFSGKTSSSKVYSSSSNGLHFEEILDNLQSSYIIKNELIDGIWLGNTLVKTESEKGDKHIPGRAGYAVKSKMSYDDGKTWNSLKIIDDPECSDTEQCSLNLFQPAEDDGQGNYVTGPTPGILMAVGNKGKFLTNDFSEMHTWISRDAGITWKFAIREPCKFSFGDYGNIILAVPYGAFGHSGIDRFYFSVDQGMNWSTAKLEATIFPLNLITAVDGSSSKFFLSGAEVADRVLLRIEVAFLISFEDLFEGAKCSDNDMEEFSARTPADGIAPVCVYGHQEIFKRRKRDSKCLVGRLYEDLVAAEVNCKCTEDDFECNSLSNNLNGECKLDEKKIVEKCNEIGKGEIEFAEKLLKSGNTCKSPEQISKNYETIKINCAKFLSKHDNKKHGSNKQIETSMQKFLGSLEQYTYLSSEEEGAGENILVKTTAGKLYASNNGGKSFIDVELSEKVLGFYTDPKNGAVILITDSEFFYVSYDGGNIFNKQKVPAPPNKQNLRIVSFNSENPKQFLWLGDGCNDSSGSDCKATAYYTLDGGNSFEKLIERVNKCEYVHASLDKTKCTETDLIFCTIENSDNHLFSLLASSDYFRSSHQLFDSVVGFVITGQFAVVAVSDTSNSLLKSKVTVDGITFADAHFPPDFHAGDKQAFTILDSASKAIFMHVTTKNYKNHESGSILKSNSDGVSYVLSLDNVNRNELGFVDYNRIQSSEGSIISNIVMNPDESTKKKLKTVITHNDGSEWNYLNPPTRDSKGNRYKCIKKSLEKCSLNLHGYTERKEYSDSFSSESAAGLILGVGNVASSLGDKEDAATFMSSDGGVTWKEIRKGVHMWEFGDRGTIIVLVDSVNPTNKIAYSLDNGKNWHDYKFSNDTIEVIDLATVPSDTSMQFLIFGRSEADTLTYSIDFRKVFKRQCQLDLDNPANDDFEFWSLELPGHSKNCLFGKEIQYLRRAEGHDDCFIGNAPLKDGFKEIRNCTCTRSDFECDYNFFRDRDNTCKLIKGLSPSDHMLEQCKNNAFEYSEPTGYRKIPLSTCVGGKSFDSWIVHPCPGKEKEFNKHYGKDIKGSKLFFIIVIPLLVFFFATWFVYDRGIRRNGGFERLGQIRLASDDEFRPIEDNTVDVVVNRTVRGGIFIVSAIFATFKTIKKFDQMLLDKILGRVFGGNVGSRNYVRVPADEDELFFENYQDNLQDNPEGETVRYETDTPDVDSNSLDRQSPDSVLFGIDDQSEEDVE